MKIALAICQVDSLPAAFKFFCQAAPSAGWTEQQM
jgi:hypothetical protein